MSFATSGSAFGIQSSAPANASIFGTKPATPSLFGQPAQQQQQPATALFGQPAQQQQPASTSLFGQPAQQQQPASTGIFGQPQQQTNLFGQPQGQQPQQNPPSLFGQPAGGNTSLFGQTQTTQQPQPQQNAFGQTSTWGTAPLTAQPTQPAGSFASNSLFGGQQKPQTSFQQPQQQQQANGAPLFLKSTKFNDLSDGLKKTLETIDSHIQGRIQISKELHQRKLGDEAMKGQELIRGMRQEIVDTSSDIRADFLFTRDLKAKADQAVQDTIVATRIVDGFKNPQQNGAYLKNHASFPLEFFTRVTGQMKERLQWYRTTVEQIERKLSSSAAQSQYTPPAISATLQAQHATFISLASKTAELDRELEHIKTIYTQLWRSKTGSIRDPFKDRAAAEELGMSGIS